MVEEFSIAFAEIVQAWVAAWCMEKTILGTAAVADKAYLAVEAVLGKRVSFGVAETSLPREFDEIGQGRFEQIAKLVLRVDEVVAGVEVAVVFDG